MKKTYKNVLFSLLAIGLLAGCSQKDVGYEAGNQGNVDNKMNQIAGEESSVEGAVDESMSNSLMSSSDADTHSVTSEINGKKVLLESIHFAFDKYNITDDMREVATTNAGKIQTVNDGYNNLKIKLEGNCDEFGSDEYNYALGLKRAKSAKDALVADGVDASKIMMVSFGESNPVCKEKNDKCWKLNRRVDYRLLP
jgi:peptidoglycan-associated lipoprotein